MEDSGGAPSLGQQELPKSLPGAATPAINRQRSNTYQTDALGDAAKEYAGYFAVDNSKQLKQIEDSVDDMLARLEEFSGFTSSILSQSVATSAAAAPILAAHCQSIEETFGKIDALDLLVHTVRRNLAELQARVERAEEEERGVSGGGSVRKLLSALPLFGRKASASTGMAAATVAAAGAQSGEATAVAVARCDGGREGVEVGGDASSAGPVRIHKTSDYFQL